MSVTHLHRRDFLAALGASGALLQASLARAASLPASVRTGTIKDVEHIVILTQENRAFDHYFGTLNGVRGFGDRFPIPTMRNGDGYRSSWLQPNEHQEQAPPLIAPFHLNTVQTFDYMRVESTPHGFTDSQEAWDQGRMRHWPQWKRNHSMGYYKQDDIPFQFALADAFTICDAYFCSMHCSTNPNRLFIWTGTNDPAGKNNGPVINNDYDDMHMDKDGHGGYTWTTYPERLQAAGISWQIYQNMDDNYTDNPLEGFRIFRDAANVRSGPLLDLAKRGVTTRDLDKLRADVLADQLPQVSWIAATAVGSEHPGASSPAQGADYIARVLDALTANPDVWSKTVFLINFDENDGFFDHVPPPAAPARDPANPARLIGKSNIAVDGEYHEPEGPYQHRPYGLGPRVPLYVISPWSRGGYVNSQVFDHTSVLRFIEARFAVMEPNITPWRRAICGDLTSCFDFKNPNNLEQPPLPATADQACRAGRLGKVVPETPQTSAAPVQAEGVRRARILPYRLTVDATPGPDGIRIDFANDSLNQTGAAFYIYDRLKLDAVPRRYSIRANSRIDDHWPMRDGAYDLWLTGPDGFHRHWQGKGMAPVRVSLTAPGRLNLVNLLQAPLDVNISDEAYGQPPHRLSLDAGETRHIPLNLAPSHGWYDISIVTDTAHLRYAGHMAIAPISYSDPAMHGAALLQTD